MKLNCIAIDDEPLALDIIKEYCSKISFLHLVKTFDNALDVLEYMKNNQVDLMFLDIQMEELTGIQLLNIIQNRPRVIMTTAYESYALKGYELDVSDYLLKPISFERFTKAVNKVYEGFQLQRGKGQIENVVQKEKSNTKEDYFFIKADGRLVKILFKDIFYIEGQGDYLMIVTGKGKFMTLQNFSTILKSLPYPDFIRIHKSFIISFDKIDKVEKNRVIINTREIPISDTYKNEFFRLVREKEV